MVFPLKEYSLKDVNVSLEQVQAIQEANLDGVYLVNDVKRSYPYGNLLAQTIGLGMITRDYWS